MMNFNLLLIKLSLTLGLLGFFIYFTWRASPFLQQIPWMPDWLGRWADANGNLRNLPAFAVLAYGLMGCLGARVGIGLSFALAVGLEVGQVCIPTRFFSWADIWISCLGVGLAGFSVWLFRAGRNFLVVLT